MLRPVAKEGQHREVEREQREPVEDDRARMWVPVADELFDDNLRGERQERGEQEHEEVEPVQIRIALCAAISQPSSVGAIRRRS